MTASADGAQAPEQGAARPLPPAAAAPAAQEAPQDDDWVPADDTVIGTAFRWSLLALLVIAAAAGVTWLVRSRPAAVPVTPPRELVLPRAQERPAEPPAVRFADITRAAGIDFVHTNGARGQKYLPETMGSGVVFFDYDEDGDADLFFVNSCAWPWDSAPAGAAPTLALYENDGTGRFRDVTANAGLAHTFYGMGAAAGDYDSDGDVDLFVTAVGENRLFRNDAGTFREVAREAGVAGVASQWSSGAAFFDADRDADLDLLVCNYVQWSKEIDEKVGYQLVGVGRAYGPPTNFGGAQSYYYRNEGNGTFREMAKEAGMWVTQPATGVPVGKGLAAVPVDLDRDGWLDVVIANDTVRKFLFHNLGGGKFEEIGESAGVAYSSDGLPTGAMGIDAAYYRNDLALAVAIGNFANEMTSFYVSQKSPLFFADQSMAEGIGAVSRQNLTFGVFFFDYDLDGRNDLMLANGHLEEEINAVQPSQHYKQSARLFWNSGNARGGCMVAVDAATLGDLPRPLVGRGASFADIEGDGDLDVVLTQVAGEPMLLRNEQSLGHHWLRLSLRGAPGRSNLDAIGALVEVRAGGAVQRKTVMPARSYLSQVELPLTFGLGKEEAVAEVRITWPDGETVDLGALAADRAHRIEQTSR
ncbi:MAG: CRTAC1 family protein [Planctomycetes bacterium]|nr:CRTAC1 family protein [Planctomycetota bacterium]